LKREPRRGYNGAVDITDLDDTEFEVERKDKVKKLMTLDISYYVVQAA
jgi:hypothetical protein